MNKCRCLASLDLLIDKNSICDFLFCKEEEMKKITENDLKELESELERLIYAPTKAYANPLADNLRFKANSFVYENPYDRIKLVEAIGYAKEASGRSSNKEHWINCFKCSWYVFENNIKNSFRSEAREIEPEV